MQLHGFGHLHKHWRYIVSSPSSSAGAPVLDGIPCMQGQIGAKGSLARAFSLDGGVGQGWCQGQVGASNVYVDSILSSADEDPSLLDSLTSGSQHLEEPRRGGQQGRGDKSCICATPMRTRSEDMTLQFPFFGSANGDKYILGFVCSVGRAFCIPSCSSIALYSFHPSTFPFAYINLFHL